MLAESLAETRSRVAAVVPELSDLAFDNPPEAVGSWLSDVAAAAVERRYLGAQPTDSPVETIYVEMNDFVFNTDLWMLSALAFGPSPADGEVSVSEWFDALVGEELGDVRVPPLELAGMEAAQRWFESTGRGADDEVARPVEKLVRLSLFAVLDRALNHTEGFDFRLVARRHEEPSMCVWEPSDDGSFRHALHDEDAP